MTFLVASRNRHREGHIKLFELTLTAVASNRITSIYLHGNNNYKYSSLDMKSLHNVNIPHLMLRILGIVKYLSMKHHDDVMMILADSTRGIMAKKRNFHVLI